MAMASLSDDIEVGWGQDHSFFYMDGPDDNQTLALCLDETHGSGFHTKEAYLYARFDIDIMLVPNNSAGTVTTIYVSLHPPECHARACLVWARSPCRLWIQRFHDLVDLICKLMRAAVPGGCAVGVP
jgi:hypothetical protein